MSRKKLHTLAFLILCAIGVFTSCKKEETEKDYTDYSSEGGCTSYCSKVPPAVFTMDSTLLQDHYNVNDTLFIVGTISGENLDGIFHVNVLKLSDSEILYEMYHLPPYSPVALEVIPICDTVVVNSAAPDSLTLKVYITQHQPAYGASWGCVTATYMEWTKTVAIN